MVQALSGTRILDLSSGPAGGITTMILADFGAEVLRIERPDGDRLNALPASRMWHRGKHLLPLDLNTEADMVALDELCAAADVLVCTWRPAALRAKRLDFENLHLRHPHLVFCHITGFGSTGPLQDCPGYEHLVAAYTGRMRNFSGLVDRSGPAFSALQVGVHACAQSATTGVLAALFSRVSDKTAGAAGRLVETSLLQGFLAYEQGAMLGTQFRDQLGDLATALQPPPDEPPMPSLYYHPAQAGDGRWMQFGNLLPHLFDNFLIATGLIDVVTDPDFNAQQLALPPEKHEAFRERMLSRIQERSAEEWMSDFIADGGVVATPYQTTQEALRDPDIVANGHTVPLGEEGVQLGTVARLTATPGAAGRPLEHASEALLTRWRTSRRSAATPQSDAEPAPPLSGLRVVELATIIAAPLGASFLADLGADVIKVEQVGGDPYRGMALGMGAARVNAGKRSVSIDMKSDAGREIVQHLVSGADVLIHNFRPGVPERLGIGYAEVAARNPGIVYLQCNGYGPDGPGAQRPSTHPIPGAAMGGVMFQLGHRVPSDLQDMDGLRQWTRRLMRANEVNPDPNTALVVATSALLGLTARRETGTGQRILVDMFGANAYANHDDFLSYPGKSDRVLPDEGLYGLSATYRLYECKQQQWIFLALTTPRERAQFTAALAETAIESPDLGRLSDDALQSALAALFKTRDADEWQSTLTRYGVACVRADGPIPSEFWLQDPQAAALALTRPAHHPSLGQYQRHGAMVHFDHSRSELKGPPSAGQHNQEVIQALGYTTEQIAHLYAAGVLWQDEQ